MTTGDVTLEYSYNEDGDLVSATDKSSARKDIAYNEKGWIERIDNFDPNLEYVSSMEYKQDWNGRLDITLHPANTSHTLVHDKTGNVVSISTNGGPPDLTVELPYGRQRLQGDEVNMHPVELEK